MTQLATGQEWPVNICTALDLEVSNMLSNVMCTGKFSESNASKQFT